MGEYVLGIESTAHTFGVGVVDLRSFRILANVWRTYSPPPGSGIHPREAAEHHAAHGPRLVREALGAAGVSLRDVVAVAYSAGPGLGPSLRVGAVIARALAAKLEVPLVPVHHGVAHVEVARYATGSCDPLVLLVSGGHTMVLGFADGRYRVFGETLDVAVGNALDKVARMLGLPNPGVPYLEKCAESGRRFLDVPISIVGQDVSFSGLVTRAEQLLREGADVGDICLSVVEAAYYALAEVVERALAFTGKRELVVSGGVARSARLRRVMEAVAEMHGAELRVVPFEYAGDNGAMIALTGALAFRRGVAVDVDRSFVNQSWRLDDVEIPWFWDLCARN